MSRPPKRKASLAVKAAAAVCLSLGLVGCIGMGIAAAGNSVVAAGDFGLDGARGTSAVEFAVTDGEAFYEASSLSMPNERDITSSISAIEAEERAAAEAQAAAEAAAAERAAQAEAEQRAKEATVFATAAAPTDEATLEDVDWSCGKDAFLAEWTDRIDAYLVGTPLAGYGATFALAAWENGVDPRFSPAISNTESSNGAVCFKPHNAWGWGQSSWSNWEEAINAHVAGLARGYGYSLSYANAQKYCPPNADHWYRNTLSQMASI